MFRKIKLYSIIFTCFCLGSFSGVNPRIASAQNMPQACEPALDTKILEVPANNDNNRQIVTAESLRQTGLTIPSLWWAKEQFDMFGGKLINNWIADLEQKRIDLIINRQLWSLLNYMDRYRFVNQFGTVARNYGYQLRVFNQQKKYLASYYYDVKCNQKWDIDFDSSFQHGLEIEQQ